MAASLSFTFVVRMINASGDSESIVSVARTRNVPASRPLIMSPCSRIAATCAGRASSVTLLVRESLALYTAPIAPGPMTMISMTGFCARSLQPSQHFLPARRDSVADFEAFGQTQRLELTHMSLEPWRFVAQPLRQERRAPGGCGRDRTEYFASPRTLRAVPIHPCQSGEHFLQLTLAQLRVVTQGHAFVPTRQMEANAVERAVGMLPELGKQSLPRLASCRARVGLCHSRRLDHVHGFDCQHAIRNSQRAAGLHRRPHPATKRDRDRARYDAVDLVALE